VRSSKRRITPSNRTFHTKNGALFAQNPVRILDGLYTPETFERYSSSV